MEFFRRLKPLKVKVTTMDADLNAIVIELDCTGREFYDKVCRIIGLREIWYFGLQYTNKKGYSCWLQFDRKIAVQSVPIQEDGMMHFLFLVKFYPEIIDQEIIQDITRHLFFLQIKQGILSMDLYCQPEAAVLLASYAVQALYGDCSEEIELELDKLLPPSVIEQYDMSSEMWASRIRMWWMGNTGMSVEEAEMEYLRVAQDLYMYGIHYYPIFNQKDTDLLLGISAQGIAIYETNNRMSPRTSFSWSEIKHVSFENKLFVIKVVDKSKIKFRAQDMSINQSILDLCIGTHNLYLRRRQPDTLEVQQMKIQAKEDRKKRGENHQKLLKEREMRIQAELERDRLKKEIEFMSEKLQTMQRVMREADETNKLIDEKARVYEKEALELSKRASEAEAEVQRIKMSQIQAEETKMALERKVRETELMTHRLMQDRSGRDPTQYYSQIQLNDVENPSWYRYEYQMTQQQRPTHHVSMMPIGEAYQVNSFITQPPVTLPKEDPSISSYPMSSSTIANYYPTTTPSIVSTTVGPTPTLVSLSTTNLMQGVHNGASSAANIGSNYRSQITLNSTAMPLGPMGATSASLHSSQLFNAELQNLYAEIEKSKNEYVEKNRNLRDRLLNFRAELDALKLEDKQTVHDQVYDTNLKHGIDKYSSLRKSGAGTTKSRIQIVDGL